jgi:hypothetical protein
MVWIVGLATSMKQECLRRRMKRDGGSERRTVSSGTGWRQCLVWKEPAPIRNADMERWMFEEFRDQQELRLGKRDDRLDGLGWGEMELIREQSRDAEKLQADQRPRGEGASERRPTG